jgi:hypothetical protein
MIRVVGVVTGAESAGLVGGVGAVTGVTSCARFIGGVGAATDTPVETRLVATGGTGVGDGTFFGAIVGTGVMSAFP